MGFIAHLVYDIKPVFIGQFQILIHRRIVRGTYGIEIKLFQQSKILAYGGFVHDMSLFGMLHVRILCIDFQWDTVKIKDTVFDFRLFESDDRFYLVFLQTGRIG